MENIKNKLSEIIEQASCISPKCQNCQSYKNGGCSFGCLNEKVRITSPNYSCDNFKANYSFDEKTLNKLNNLLNEAEKVDAGIKNLNLLLTGKITEDEFNEITE